MSHETLDTIATANPFNDRDYISVTLEFRCNLNCIHCMIANLKGQLQPQTMEQYDTILSQAAKNGTIKGIVLTGAEITLRADLRDLVRKAKKAGFAHVRLQTHGVQLAHQAYCDDLLDAGVDEFFISVAGSSAKNHDAITRVPGSFDKMVLALEYLDRFDWVNLITNTVITTASYADLPSIARRFFHFRRLSRMEFWNYWPMSERDEQNLVPPFKLLVPELREAASFLLARGKSVEVKNIPECLLGTYGGLLNNDQPGLFIDSTFWHSFNRNGFHQCVHREFCCSRQCLGLNSAYIEKYGWEQGIVHPID